MKHININENEHNGKEIKIYMLEEVVYEYCHTNKETSRVNIV